MEATTKKRLIYAYELTDAQTAMWGTGEWRMYLARVQAHEPTNEDLRAAHRFLAGPKSSDTDPRRWASSSVEVGHWWWQTVNERWLHCTNSEDLRRGDIFVRGNALRPQSAPDDVLAECTQVDWE